jgi:hypothetical protein
VGVSTSRDSASITSIATKWRETKVAVGQVRRIGWVEDDSHVFGQKLPGKKGRVKLYVVMQQPILLSPNIGAKSLHNFTQSPLNVTIVCGIDCLVCQDEFCVNNSPLMLKKMFSMILTLFYTFLAFSALGELRLSVYGSYFFPELFISRISVALFPRFSLNLTFFCRIRSEIASGQIQDSKIKDAKINTPTQLCVNFFIRTPKIF